MAMEAVGIAANVIAVVNLSAKLSWMCGEYINKARKAKEDIHRLKTESDALGRNIGQIEELVGDNSRDEGHKRQLVASGQFREDVKQCEEMLQKLTEKLDTEKNQSRMKLLGKSLKWPFSSSEVVQKIESLRHWRESFGMALQVDSLRIALRMSDALDFGKLPAAKGAAFDTYDDELAPVCHPDTRRDLLRMIVDWADDPNGKCIFWLRGVAGTGKSTISRTVAGILAERKQLAATFFFNRTFEERNTARIFATTIARQLICRVPKLRDLILKAVQDDPDLPEKALQTQFHKLVVEPLRNLKADGPLTPTLVLIIDALDECDAESHTGAVNTENGRNRSRTVISLLSKLATIPHVRVRVFLTSRPEVPIRLGFREDVPSDSFKDVALHEIPPSIIQHDIRTFIESQLDKIRLSYQIPHDWPGDNVITQLTDISNPLFIYAATICKFINDPSQRFSPRSQLKTILSQAQGARADIGATYEPILKQLLLDLDDTRQEEVLAQFRRIVGSIVLLADPLSVSAIGQLLDIDQEEVVCHLNNLHSVLSIPDHADSEQSVKMFHLSFREYLLDSFGGRNQFWIEESSQHSELLNCCLRVMDSRTNGRYGLKTDICQTEYHGALRKEIPKEDVRKRIPKHLEYACLYWIRHLKLSQHLQANESNVHDFLARHFVHWVEAMSWLGRIHQAFDDILTLEDLFSTLCSGSPSHLFTQDARRFLNEYKYLIDLAPCQIYVSALLFTPENSIVKKTFVHEVPSWILRAPEVAQDWDSTTRTLHQYTSKVKALAYSQTGAEIAVATEREINVWHAHSGALLEVYNDLSSEVTCMSFTPAGALAVGMMSGSILLWDWLNHDEHVLDLSDEIVCYLSAATNGRLLCSFYDGGIYLLSPEFDVLHAWTACLHGSYDVAEFNKYARSGDKTLGISFSHNGQLIAFMKDTEPNHVYVYNADSGDCIRKFSAPGHCGFGGITITPENLLLADFGKLRTRSKGVECLRHPWFDFELEEQQGTYIWDLSRQDDSLAPTCHSPINPRDRCRPSTSLGGLLARFDGWDKLQLWTNFSESPQLVYSATGNFQFCFSPTGNHIATASEFGFVQVIAVNGFDNAAKHVQGAHTDDAKDDVYWDTMVPSFDGSHLAVISSGGKVNAWDINKGFKYELSTNRPEPSEQLSTTPKKAMALAWNTDGTFLAVSFEDRISIYQRTPGCQSMPELRSYEHGEFDEWGRVLISPCGLYLYVVKGGTRQRILLFDFPSLQLRWTRTFNFEARRWYSPTQLCFTPDEQYLIYLNNCWPSTLKRINSSSGVIEWSTELNAGIHGHGLAVDSQGHRIAVEASSVEKDSGNQVDNKSTHLLLLDASTGLQLSTFYPSVRLRNYQHGSSIAFACNDQVVITPDSWFILNDSKKKSSEDTTPGLRPCNVTSGQENDAGAWIVKDGRRMLYLPDHCDRKKFSVPINDWHHFPHRFYGFDSIRNVPFIIDFSCSSCGT